MFKVRLFVPTQLQLSCCRICEIHHTLKLYQYNSSSTGNIPKETIGKMLILRPLSRFLAMRNVFRIQVAARSMPPNIANAAVPIFHHQTKFADIHMVPMFEDNYGFIVVDKMTSIAACVDPGDGIVMTSALNQLKLNLDYIFCTHKHDDHVGGVLHLKKEYPSAMVIGTKYEEIPGIDEAVGEGDTFMFGFLPVQVLYTPCHTKGHISFLVMPPHVAPPPIHTSSTSPTSTTTFPSSPTTTTDAVPSTTHVEAKLAMTLTAESNHTNKLLQPERIMTEVDSEKTSNAPLLFCGDTLFVGGCGRFFEGTAEQMLANMDRFGTLPPQTNVFCAHEYTSGNMNFLLDVLVSSGHSGKASGTISGISPGTEHSDTPCSPVSINSMQDIIQKKQKEVNHRRAVNLPTVPSTIEAELQHNLFMRCREQVIQELVGVKTAEAAMARLREKKNNF